MARSGGRIESFRELKRHYKLYNQLAYHGCALPTAGASLKLIKLLLCPSC